MSEPTDKQRTAFLRHAHGLAKLGRAGLHLYLAEDNLHLMAGPSHDRKCKAQQHLVRETVIIPLSGGGDW